MNVLIIDDQPDVVEGIRQGIDWKFLGIHNVFHAYNSAAAKAVILREDIHIALCDIEMPNGSGLKLFEWACGSYPGIKFIFLTAHAGDAPAAKRTEAAAGSRIWQLCEQTRKGAFGCHSERISLWTAKKRKYRHTVPEDTGYRH